MSMREETPDNKEKRPVMETFNEEKVKKEHKPIPTQSLTWQTLRVILAGAAILATLFTIWTPASCFRAACRNA